MSKPIILNHTVAMLTAGRRCGKTSILKELLKLEAEDLIEIAPITAVDELRGQTMQILTLDEGSSKSYLKPKSDEDITGNIPLWRQNDYKISRR